jgi:hypothetical protein
VNDEFERMWEGVVVTYFNVLSQHLSEGTEEHEENLSVWPISGPTFKFRATSRT